MPEPLPHPLLKGGSRLALMAYAARQVLAARQLRASLQVPHRRGGVP